jgi:hypothetical protein
MGTLRIEQYSGTAVDQSGVPMQMPSFALTAAAENLNTSGTSAASAVLNGGTRAVLLRSTGATSVAVRIASSVGGDPVAVATDAMIASGETRWFAIPAALVGPSLKIAAIDI